MAQVRKALPFKISFRPSGTTANFQDPYNSYEFALGGIPFLSAVDQNHPFIRSTAQFKKDQIDQSSEPGEQTLVGWWLRSQSSFHLGGGLVNEDPQLDQTAPYRFADAEGVDVWTLGQFGLLNSMSNVSVGGSVSNALGVTAGSINGVLYSYGTNLKLVDQSGSVTTVNYPGTNPILSIASDGRNWYAAAIDGIWYGDMTTPATAGVKLWTVSATNVVIRWVKNRLMGGIDNKIYQLIDPGGAAPHALPTATYGHPNANYIWTDIDEGPNVIYASGYLGADSSILKIQLDTSGVLPTLTTATTVAQLPRNEICWSLYSYMGTFLVIGTSLGVRIAEVMGTSVSTYAGDISYGPLHATPSPVRDCVGIDHFIYAGFSKGFSDGTSGVMCIDLAQQLPNQKYANAKHLRTHTTGDVVGVTTVGTTNRIAIACLSDGLYFQSTTNLETSGYLKTARIRYNTTWPKLYKRFSVRGDINGTVTVATINDANAETNIVTLDSSFDQLQDLNIAFPDGPEEWLALKFTLNRLDATHGPVLRSYQLKALPGGPRQRSIVMPLLCYDSEKDYEQDTIAHDGWAMERLFAVEALDSSGQVVLWENLIQGTSELVVIDEIEFRQLAPPGSNGENWGGILTVSLRTVE